MMKFEFIMEISYFECALKCVRCFQYNVLHTRWPVAIVHSYSKLFVYFIAIELNALKPNSICSLRIVSQYIQRKSHKMVLYFKTECVSYFSRPLFAQHNVDYISRIRIFFFYTPSISLSLCLSPYRFFYDYKCFARFFPLPFYYIVIYTVFCNAVAK